LGADSFDDYGKVPIAVSSDGRDLATAKALIPAILYSGFTGHDWPLLHRSAVPDGAVPSL